MPSPFPGMDPYAEQGEVWPELHDRLMIYVCDGLQPVLPDAYVARLEFRIYIERETANGDYRVPDLEVVRRSPQSGPVATIEREAPGRGYWVVPKTLERKEAYVTIRRHPSGELVTAVELLSPSNKAPGSGRRAYLQKQRELLDAEVSLVEIDLLRRGRHTVAVPREDLADLPAGDYLYCIRRADRPEGFWVDPFTVRNPLPPLPVPLSDGDPDIEVQLQPLFERAYDNAAVPKLVNYTAEPDPPLSAEDAVWADELLRRAGLRGDAGA